jgi:hypothetical protein
MLIVLIAILIIGGVVIVMGIINSQNAPVVDANHIEKTTGIKLPNDVQIVVNDQSNLKYSATITINRSDLDDVKSYLTEENKWQKAEGYSDIPGTIPKDWVNYDVSEDDGVFWSGIHNIKLIIFIPNADSEKYDMLISDNGVEVSNNIG